MTSLSNIEAEFKLVKYKINKETYLTNKLQIGVGCLEYNNCYIIGKEPLNFNLLVRYVKFFYKNKPILMFEEHTDNEKLKEILRRIQ